MTYDEMVTFVFRSMLRSKQGLTLTRKYQRLTILSSQSFCDPRSDYLSLSLSLLGSLLGSLSLSVCPAIKAYISVTICWILMKLGESVMNLGPIDCIKISLHYAAPALRYTQSA